MPNHSATIYRLNLLGHAVSPAAAILGLLLAFLAGYLPGLYPDWGIILVIYFVVLLTLAQLVYRGLQQVANLPSAHRAGLALLTVAALLIGILLWGWPSTLALPTWLGLGIVGWVAPFGLWRWSSWFEWSSALVFVFSAYGVFDWLAMLSVLERCDNFFC